MTWNSIALSLSGMLDEAEPHFGAGTNRRARQHLEFARPAADSMAVPVAVSVWRQDDGGLNLQVSEYRVEPGNPSAMALVSTVAPTATHEIATQPTDPGELTITATGELRRDGAALALVIHLMPPSQRDLEAPQRPENSGLPKWRLKRVVDYIEANYAEPISLQELADTAGLSPTYFAAQFRIATGFRPHEYILRRRIHHAQRLLRDPRVSIVEIALSVGFQTQAHFTTLFKRFVSETPCCWRHRHIDS